MSGNLKQRKLTRRTMLGGAAALAPAVRTSIALAEEQPLSAVAGVDRVVVLPAKTYLRGWAGFGAPPRAQGRGSRGDAPLAPPPAKPAPPVAWSKESGPGKVAFADPEAPTTVASFTAPGAYVLKLTASDGNARASSTLNVQVEPPLTAQPLNAVYTKNFSIRRD